MAGSIPPELSAARPVPPKDLVRAVGQVLDSVPIRDGTRIRLSLSPAHLGELSIELSVAGSRIRGRVRTRTAAARDLISAHLDDLRRDLEKRGLRLSRFEIEVDGPMGEGKDQGAGVGGPRSRRRQVLDLQA